jgi:hypothetical protein
VTEKRWFTSQGAFTVGFGAAGKAWVASGLLASTSLAAVPIVVFDEPSLP